MINLFGGGISNMILTLLVRAFVLLAVLPIHEFAHAWSAYKLGDGTAKWQGRLTVNPFAHLDLLGSLSILLVGIGWAKPVPINPYNFKGNRKTGVAITSFAGPASNILVAFVALLVFRVLYALLPIFTSNFVVSFVFYTFVQINITLAVFNLIPVPPLDGFGIMEYFLPDRLVYQIRSNERLIYFLVLALLLTGVASPIIGLFSNMIYEGMSFLVNLPFALLGL